MLVLADEYMLDHLKQLCEARLTVSGQSPVCSVSRPLRACVVI